MSNAACAHAQTPLDTGSSRMSQRHLFASHDPYHFTVPSRNVRQRTFGYLRPANIQVSLRFRALCSESSLGAFLIAKNAKILHADN